MEPCEIMADTAIEPFNRGGFGLCFNQHMFGDNLVVR